MVLGAFKRSQGISYSIQPGQGLEKHKQIQKEAQEKNKNKNKTNKTKSTARSRARARNVEIFGEKHVANLEKKHKKWKADRAAMQKLRSTNPKKYREIKRQQRREKMKLGYKRGRMR